jgi:hypothetical protein
MEVKIKTPGAQMIGHRRHDSKTGGKVTLSLKCAAQKSIGYWICVNLSATSFVRSTNVKPRHGRSRLVRSSHGGHGKVDQNSGQPIVLTDGKDDMSASPKESEVGKNRRAAGIRRLP